MSRRTLSVHEFAGGGSDGGYQDVKRNELRTPTDSATWAPWAREFLGVVDEVRTVAMSSEDETIKRLKVAELGVRARRLLDEVDGHPSFPGGLGRAIDVLRSPSDADPVSVGDAIARLGRMALLFETGSDQSRRKSRSCGVRRSADQDSFPGFEPGQLIEGVVE